MEPQMTYKFLARGAMGPISGFAWPAPRGGVPGAWVEAVGPLALCENGAHVCRAFELAHWLHDELWETETDGDELLGLDCLVVRRARLVRRIDAWHQGGAARFAAACVEHAAALADRAPPELAAAVKGVLDDAAVAARTGYPAVGAYAAAVSVASLGDPGDRDRPFRRERLWQSEWIAGALLPTGPDRAPERP
jgi:hypothetical protein